jgi:zinc D-Ala-D-Ala carboxypeptidase
MRNISEHITYKEAIRSNTAERLAIDNHPEFEELCNMRVLANAIFEPLRKHFGNLPIFISSFFRSFLLNREVGGSKSSSHIDGEAIDLDDILGGASNSEMFYWILDNLSFDQLIWEFGDDKEPRWIHVSYVNETQNRCQVLKAEKYTNMWCFEKSRYVNFVDRRK